MGRLFLFLVAAGFALMLFAGCGVVVLFGGAYQDTAPAGANCGITAQPVAATGPAVGVVNDYSATQLANAQTIVNIGTGLNVPPYGLLVGIATAIGESTLLDAPGGDRDSLGLFQQRPSQGWGTPAQIMDTSYASAKFFTALLGVRDWQSMSVTEAAHSTQGNAVADYYTQFVNDAKAILAKIQPNTRPASAPRTTCTPAFNTMPVSAGRGGTHSARGDTVIAAAESLLGTPYVWGGSTEASGLDCSGMTRLAYSMVGIALPHNAAMQSGMMPHYPLSAAQPGDLLFFGSPIHHVGMYLGPTQMIDAPHAGTAVRVEDFHWFDLLPYVGRPT
jgi:cell wall-associated NlpC family hydrolase